MALDQLLNLNYLGLELGEVKVWWGLLWRAYALNVGFIGEEEIFGVILLRKEIFVFVHVIQLLCKVIIFKLRLKAINLRF